MLVEEREDGGVAPDLVLFLDEPGDCCRGSDPATHHALLPLAANTGRLWTGREPEIDEVVRPGKSLCHITSLA